MTTDEEIRRLESDGLSPRDRISVGHFFSHFGSTWSERRAFRDALERAGFGAGGTIGCDEEVTGDGYWHHWAYTTIRASAEECQRMETLAKAIAEQHGVKYNRWIVDRDVDGKPRV